LNLKLFEKKVAKQARYQKSYSQTGEDVIIEFILKARGITKWTWLDIGAHDPEYLSNTAMWYGNGMRGINVEANPKLTERFSKNRAKDINLNIAVADTNGTMDFYVMDPDTLSTLSEEEAEHFQTLGHRISEKIQIKTMTVPDIIKNFAGGKFPDVLLIDAEGYELPILKTIDWDRAKPKIICLESAPYDSKFKNYFKTMQKIEMIQYLEQRGYSVAAFTGLNTILTLDSFLEPGQA
jgi:FkbM family methyltransferase